MSKTLELPFTIEGADPDCLPLSRLADYLADLAKLFGSPEHVHFKEQRKGSAVLACVVDEIAQPVVLPRIRAASRGEGDPESAGAWLRINKRLSEDSTTAILPLPGAEIIAFPGSPKSDRPLGPLHQTTTIQGRLVRMEGTGEAVSVGIEDEAGIAGKIVIEAKMAAELGTHFHQYVRLTGAGRWRRSAAGKWVLERLDVASFEILENAPLDEVLRQAREKVPPGSGVEIINSIKELGSG